MKLKNILNGTALLGLSLILTGSDEENVVLDMGPETCETLFEGNPGRHIKHRTWGMIYETCEMRCDEIFIHEKYLEVNIELPPYKYK